MRPAVARLAAFENPDAGQLAVMEALGEEAAKPGVYFLVDDDTGAIIEPAWLYLHGMYAHAGLTTESNPHPSFHSSKKRAYLLAEWLEFIDKISRTAWRTVDHNTLCSYATYQISMASPTTGNKREPSTVGAKVAVVDAFYKYMNAVGLTKVTWDRASIKARFNNASSRRRVDNELVRPFMDDEVARISDELGPLPLRRANGDQRSSRDRLLFEIGIRTGMRGEEICFLTKAAFRSLKPDLSKPRAKTPIRIKITKNRVFRTVLFPDTLIAEIQRYIGTERKRAVEGRHKQDPADHGFLFVNLADSSRPGRALKTNTIHRRFAALMRRLDMTTDEDRVIKKEPRVVAVPDHSFHDTRHYFAVAYYVGLKREVARDPAALNYSEPWELVQNALGHADWETTRKHYLNHVPAYEAQISDRVDRFFGDAV